jgi:hypothetical protein
LSRQADTRCRTTSPVLVLRQSIVSWLTVWQRHVGSICFSKSYIVPYLGLHLYTATTSVRSTSPPTSSIIIAQSMLKLISTSFASALFASSTSRRPPSSPASSRRNYHPWSSGLVSTSVMARVATSRARQGRGVHYVVPYFHVYGLYGPY